MIAKNTLAAINAALEAKQEREHRRHLGASKLGSPCARQIWYSFHWARLETFGGQMLRLFDRGEREESRFEGFLKLIGCKTWPLDPSTGKQWRISFGDGHGGGSADLVAMGIPDLPPGTPFLTECKTHKNSSFRDLVNNGLCQSKPEHFAQTQVYTVKLGLPAALYMAVNKDTDDMHLEVIQPNPGFVATLIEKGERIIWQKQAPERIGNSPGHWYCKAFCSKYRDICHNEALPDKNCRTCFFAQPRPGGQWLCTRYEYTLNAAEQHRGCADWKINPAFYE